MPFTPRNPEAGAEIESKGPELSKEKLSTVEQLKENINSASNLLESLYKKSNEVSKDLLENAKDAISDVIGKIKNNFSLDEREAFKDMMESGEAKINNIQERISSIQSKIKKIEQTIEDSEVKKNGNLEMAQVIDGKQIPDSFSAPNNGGIAILPSDNNVIIVTAKEKMKFKLDVPSEFPLVNNSIIETLNANYPDGVKCNKMQIEDGKLKVS